jgi:hypothetical protein
LPKNQSLRYPELWIAAILGAVVAEFLHDLLFGFPDTIPIWSSWCLGSSIPRTLCTYPAFVLVVYLIVTAAIFLAVSYLVGYVLVRALTAPPSLKRKTRKRAAAT